MCARIKGICFDTSVRVTGALSVPGPTFPFDNASPGEVICLAVLGQNLARVVFRLI